MSPDNEAAIQKIAEKTEALFRRLGVEPKPVRDLQRESDWAFIIKLHSLLEAGINHLLVCHFGDRRLENVMADMEMGSDRKGKFAFLKALNLLSGPSQCFIEKLGRIRNKLAHKIQNLDFNLKKYLGERGVDYRNSLAGIMCQILPKTKMREVLDNDPRKAFFATFCVILAEIHVASSRQRTTSLPGMDHLGASALEPPESKTN